MSLVKQEIDRHFIQIKHRGNPENKIEAAEKIEHKSENQCLMPKKRQISV